MLPLLAIGTPLLAAVSDGGGDDTTLLRKFFLLGQPEAFADELLKRDSDYRSEVMSRIQGHCSEHFFERATFFVEFRKLCERKVFSCSLRKSDGGLSMFSMDIPVRLRAKSDQDPELKILIEATEYLAKLFAEEARRYLESARGVTLKFRVSRASLEPEVTYRGEDAEHIVVDVVYENWPQDLAYGDFTSFFISHGVAVEDR